MSDLTGFLLARIAEDETVARLARPDDHLATRGWSSLTVMGNAAGYAHVVATSGRILAECDAKRRIVEAESRWRRTKENVTVDSFKSLEDRHAVTWLDERGRPHQEDMTEAEFVERFTEPAPPSQTLLFLALPYADHEDFREEWKP